VKWHDEIKWKFVKFARIFVKFSLGE